MTGVNGPDYFVTDLSCALPREAWVEDRGFGPVPVKPGGGWRLIDYVCDQYEGRLLTTCQADAATLRIPLDLSGWHAVSLGIGIGQKKATCVLEVRLSGQDQWQRLIATGPHEEAWTIADLTGRDLEIRPAADLRSFGAIRTAAANLMSVRATPLSPEDVSAIQSDPPRKLVYLNDGHGLFYHDPSPGPHTVNRALEPFANSDWRVCCFGVGGADLVNYPSAVGTMMGHGWDVGREGDAIEAKMDAPMRAGWDPLRQAVDLAHEQGQEFWMYIRPQGWLGTYGYDHAFRSEFYGRHQHCRCVEADGKPIAQLSIACPEVRAQLNAIAAESLDRDADGVCIALVRGYPLVRYEEPVCRQFTAKYGADMRSRPDTDPEVRLIWREFVEAWLRELRDLLDRAGPAVNGRHRVLSVICGATPEWNLRFGVDVGHFAREGLLDSVMPYPTIPIEEEMDVAAYRDALRGTDAELIPSLGYYGDHDKGLGAYRRLAHDYYRSGATGLCRWDTDAHLARVGLDRPAEVALWSEVCQPEKRPLKMVEIGGVPLGPFSPNVGL